MKKSFWCLPCFLSMGLSVAGCMSHDIDYAKTGRSLTVKAPEELNLQSKPKTIVRTLAFTFPPKVYREIYRVSVFATIAISVDDNWLSVVYKTSNRDKIDAVIVKQCTNDINNCITAYVNSCVDSGKNVSEAALEEAIAGIVASHGNLVWLEPESTRVILETPFVPRD